MYIAQLCGCAGVLSIVKSREFFISLFIFSKKSRRFKNKKEKPERGKIKSNRRRGKVRETNKWSVCGDYFDSS